MLRCGPSRTAGLGTTGYYWGTAGVHTGYHGAPMGYYGVLMGYTWGYTRIAPHTSIPHLGSRWRSTRHLGWDRKAPLPRLGSYCEGMEGVRWVLIEYSRRAPLLRACSIAPGRAQSWICGRCRKSHVDGRALVRCVLDTECACSRPHHRSANDGRADVCAGRYSPVAAGCAWSGRLTQAALDRLRPTRPWQPRPWQAPLTIHAVPHARAGSALSAAVNVTYAAVDVGLVAWLNNHTASYASTTVHVTLPSGNVARGNAPLRLPSGINLILQGQGMAGASNTTFDLENNNLEVGGMLGDGGRIEFRNMGVRNVRPSLASAAVHVCLMTPWLLFAGLCGAPASAPTPADARAGCVVTPWWCTSSAAWFMHRDQAVRPVNGEPCIAGSGFCCVAARRML